ncbi:head protein [Roseobacter sp. HKCCD9010]|uniref:Mu-like prophage major head subunit gpT family protein n=1 Tax=unclassified Roseobacter TaxID=196798 RepID=UPI001492E857|nr:MULTISPECIES: Mu-like prophage major head subunit gpT family protein [unclassified Roseobacter]MBF9049892.1 head protein [Rhodobacterales bacterium HKCCD4356]NNV13569.1 head protein [Roseobacter sp. HKCCD7357]NNV16403.1 head protein [Roseobacter sp. HKCCD8768]NNV25862.1 head protein [Roseobacter sp. HKCCD8192]NNV30120.1 head protein [Roseobacter sp. HKCCD9061]
MMVTAASLTALQVGFKKNFQDAFTATRPDADFTSVATVITSTSKSETYGWLGKFPKMREWVGARVIKDMEAKGYTITNKDFESTVGVERNDIEDDNLGVYGPLMQEMGVSAAQQPDDLTFGLMAQGRVETCYDGQYFFDGDHPSFNENGDAITVSNVDASGAVGNPWWYLLDVTRPLKPMIYQERKKPQFVAKTDPQNSDHVFMNKEFLYGVDARSNVGFGLWQMAYASNAALDGDSLDAAIEKMRGLRDSNGRPLGIKPSLMVVGPKLRSAANKTVKVMLGAGGASNANYEAVDVLDTPWVA